MKTGFAAKDRQLNDVIRFQHVPIGSKARLKTCLQVDWLEVNKMQFKRGEKRQDV